jgi:hypothetical protein
MENVFLFRYNWNEAIMQDLGLAEREMESAKNNF